MNESNWYVITGGPSAGKTTVLKLLEKKGYHVVEEAARIFINQEIAKGKSIEEIRGNEATFQKKILDLKIKKEKQLSRDQIIFFDRGIPDSLAYYDIAGLPIDDDELEEAVRNSCYKKIFLLDLLDFEIDYARTDQKDAQKIQKLLKKYYEAKGFKVVRVPKMSPKERIEFIIKNL